MRFGKDNTLREVPQLTKENIKGQQNSVYLYTVMMSEFASIIDHTLVKKCMHWYVENCC